MRLRNISGSKEIITSSPFVVQDPKAQKGLWAALFSNNNPIHIEIGMGKGRFLMELAVSRPDVNYVGIEMYDSVLLRAVQKLGRMQTQPSNLRLVRMDARELPDVFSSGEVARIYLNFSDPWPKDRHAKRRLTSRRFLARYEQILSPGGTVEFKTDNQDLFTFSLEEVKQSSHWTLTACTRDLHHDEQLNKGNILTEYEEKFSSLGSPICKLIAVFHP